MKLFFFIINKSLVVKNQLFFFSLSIIYKLFSLIFNKNFKNFKSSLFIVFSKIKIKKLINAQNIKISFADF